jgi:hypothetical protein
VLTVPLSVPSLLASLSRILPRSMLSVTVTPHEAIALLTSSNCASDRLLTFFLGVGPWPCPTTSFLSLLRERFPLGGAEPMSLPSEDIMPVRI